MERKSIKIMKVNEQAGRRRDSHVDNHHGLFILKGFMLVVVAKAD